MVKKGKNQYWGFTLIELLTVIVILGLILLITIPIIFKIIEDAKRVHLEILYTLILNHRKLFMLKTR